MNNKEKKQFKKKMENVNQNSRYTKEELSLISNTFFERDDILMAIRKFFLQGELDARQKSLIARLSEETVKTVRKCLLPEIDPDAPFYQMTDLWVSIDTRNKLAEDVYLDMRARKIVIDYLEEQFDRLSGKSRIGIKLTDLIFNNSKDAETAFIELKARNTLLSHIDIHLEELRILAISNAEINQEEKIKRIQRNSLK